MHEIMRKYDDKMRSDIRLYLQASRKIAQQTCF